MTNLAHLNMYIYIYNISHHAHTQAPAIYPFLADSVVTTVKLKKLHNQWRIQGGAQGAWGPPFLTTYIRYIVYMRNIYITHTYTFKPFGLHLGPPF